MRLLVTGGLGYLGGRTAAFLAARPGCKVIVATRREPLRNGGLPGVQVVRVDWDSVASLERITTGVDVVVHMAGINATDAAADPVSALACNALATARLLEAAIRRRVSRFVYVSTAHVYASPLRGTITEQTCPTSLHPYATSHRAGEDPVRAMHQRGAVEGIVVRLSNAYGPPVDESADCWKLVVNDLCRQAVASGRIVLTSSGQQPRDFVPITDVCRALAHLIELPADRLGDGLFNLGGAWSPTILEMARHLAARLQASAGMRAEIVVPASDDRPVPGLDYQIGKLLATGFESGGRPAVDRELDALIRFCMARQSLS